MSWTLIRRAARDFSLRLAFPTMPVEIERPSDMMKLQTTWPAVRREMIPKRLRPIFAKERRPLLVGHLVLSLALVPIPIIRTGLAEFALVLIFTPFSQGVGMGISILFWISLFSLPLIPLFLAWSLPGSYRPGLPNRSIGALCLLIAYHPFRFYLEGIFYGEETRADAARMHERFPIVWLFKHLDTVLLLALVVWAALRRAETQPWEKAWFHCLLFVSTLWAVCAFFDPFLGFALSLFWR